MNTDDTPIDAALEEAQRLRARTKKKSTPQIRGSERKIVRATALAWFNNHRKQLTAVFTTPDLAEIDKLYQRILEASHKVVLRSIYLDILKQITDTLVEFRSSNAIRLSDASFAPPTSDAPPDFSSIVSNDLMKKILEDRWGEIASCVSAKAPLSATLRDFGVLEGAAKKKIAPAFFPVESFAYITFYLKQHQPSGAKLIGLPDWKLFFLSREAVERLLFEAHQHSLLEYHVAGSVTRLTFPAGTLEE